MFQAKFNCKICLVKTKAGVTKTSANTSDLPEINTRSATYKMKRIGIAEEQENNEAKAKL